jgi:hypothetical protein
MRPAHLTEEHLTFLDGLRESGVTNMHGGAQYLIDAFDLGRIEAREILAYWMATFGERHDS